MLCQMGGIGVAAGATYSGSGKTMGHQNVVQGEGVRSCVGRTNSAAGLSQNCGSVQKKEYRKSDEIGGKENARAASLCNETKKGSEAAE